MGQANLMINDASFESAKSILELATSAKLVRKTRSPSERKAYRDRVLSNPVLNAPVVRYDLKKPFAGLVKMRGNEK